MGFEGSNQLLRVDVLLRAEGYDILVYILWALHFVYILFIGLIPFESPTCFDILLFLGPCVYFFDALLWKNELFRQIEK